MCVSSGPFPCLTAAWSALCSRYGLVGGLMGLSQLPCCDMSATNMGLCRATGRGPETCAFLQSGSPHLGHGADTGSLLTEMGIVTGSSSGPDWAMLVQVSEESLGRAKTPMLALLEKITGLTGNGHCPWHLFWG